MANETKTIEAPPYIAFSTFSKFIKGLGETSVPDRIDKSLLRNFSGSNQSALLAALKWFKLIDEVGAPSAKLDEYSKVVDSPNPVLAELIRAAYAFVSDGSTKLDKATGSQIEEKFRAYGIAGSTVGKAMAFFISACKDASIPLSPHIKLPKIAKATSNGKAKKPATDPVGATEHSPPPAPPPKAESVASMLMKKFPDFDPQWSEDMQAKWFAAFSKMQEMLDKP